MQIANRKKSLPRHRPLVALIIAVLFPALADARPPKRFHEGPYLQLLFGAMQSDHDTLALSGTKVGDDTVPAFGFFFGWNVTDAAAVELVGRYGTAKTFGVREHVIRLGAHARWHWIADALTDAGRWRLLPFVHAGPLLEMTLLPGDPAVAETRVTQWGAGLSAGGGLNLLLYDAAYLTFIGQTDLVHRLGVSRNIGAIPTEIYRGGWDAGWSALAGVGVHY